MCFLGAECPRIFSDICTLKKLQVNIMQFTTKEALRLFKSSVNCRSGGVDLVGEQVIIQTKHVHCRIWRMPSLEWVAVRRDRLASTLRGVLKSAFDELCGEPCKELLEVEMVLLAWGVRLGH